MTRKKILVIDDDPTVPLLIADILDEFEVVTGIASGAAGIAEARRLKPDLVLIDITLPDMNGYSVCRTLKDSAETRAIPVIFMSGVVGLDEHLSGHEAGGEDFLAKPFAATALLHEVNLALHRASQTKELAERATTAFNTAMTAMTTASEVGSVLRFIQTTFSCPDHACLADALIDACGHYGLTASVQIRGGTGIISRNAGGESSALEAAVLERLSTMGRIVDFSRRSAFNYPRATLMITDMPVDEPERYGRLRDHLILMAEGADAATGAIENAASAAIRARSLSALVERTRSALLDIDRLRDSDRQRTANVMNDMVTEIERAFVHLGLSELQEEHVSEIIRNTTKRVLGILSEKPAIDAHMKLITDELGAAVTTSPR